MKPGGPLQRRTELKASRPLRRKSEMERSGRLRQQSKKRQGQNRVRRTVAKDTFGDQPLCFVPGCTRWADDVHEPLTRGRGGSVTDPLNMAPICRPHHREITDEQPAWAYGVGLLAHSWDRGDSA